MERPGLGSYAPREVARHDWSITGLCGGLPGDREGESSLPINCELL